MAPTPLRITDVHRNRHFACTRNRYHVRLFQLKSLTGSTPRRTGNTASIHHQVAARTSLSCPEQSLVSAALSWTRSSGLRRLTVGLAFSVRK
jgi:hypothetical protein